MSRRVPLLLGAGGLLAALLLGRLNAKPVGAAPPTKGDAPATKLPADDPHPAREKSGLAIPDFEWQLPNDSWKTPFKDERPILFVNRNQNPAEWDQLPGFWNEA